MERRRCEVPDERCSRFGACVHVEGAVTDVVYAGPFGGQPRCDLGSVAGGVDLPGVEERSECLLELPVRWMVDER